MIPIRMPRVFALLCLTACALAQEPSEPSEKLSPKKAAIEKLLSERGSASDFDKAAAAAKKQGVSTQTLLEARFLYLVDQRDDDKLVALLPQLLAQKDEFELADSAIFAVREDWLAIIEYVESLAALKKGDKYGFKKHITEAFWLSPRQGSAFAPHIDRLRLEEEMKAVKLSPQVAFSPMSGDKEVTLGDLSRDKKAVLLHFWSPWSRECEDSMPDFKVVASALEKGGITVVSLLVESSDEILPDAKEMLSSLGDAPPGLWMKGDSAATLTSTLRIQNVPCMVLVSPEGTILFNGEPSDDELWKALRKISPDLKRPALPKN